MLFLFKSNLFRELKSSPWWLASPQFQEKVVDSAPLRRPPPAGSKKGLERRSSGFATDPTVFDDKPVKSWFGPEGQYVKDTFTASLCGGHTLYHAPESSLLVLVFPPLIHLPPGHCNPKQKLFSRQKRFMSVKHNKNSLVTHLFFLLTIMSIVWRSRLSSARISASVTFLEKGIACSNM